LRFYGEIAVLVAQKRGIKNKIALLKLEGFCGCLH
jgi:hypothetical protein